MSSQETVFAWSDNAVKALISMWGEDGIQRILNGKTKRSAVAYQTITERMNSEFNFKCTKNQVLSKIKYLKGQFTAAKNKNRSGASRDDILKACPFWDALLPVLDHGKCKLSSSGTGTRGCNSVLCRAALTVSTLSQVTHQKETIKFS